MKYYPSQINIILQKILKKEIKALLIYGPDRGRMNETINLIKGKFNMLTSTITYDEFAKTDINIILSTSNFFKQKELIKVINTGNSLAPNMQTIPKNNFEHFPVFIGGEIKSNSAIRKFFESDKSLASIACYYDDEQNIGKLVLKTLIENNLKVEPQALNFLKTHLKGDQNFIKNELEKLIFYNAANNNEKKVTLEDVKVVLSANLTASGDEACIFFAKKDLKNFLHEVNKLLELGISEILIIRALIRYYINLYIVLVKLTCGTGLDLAIRSLEPAIFYKYIGDFKSIANTFNIKDTLKILQILQLAEKDFKSNNTVFDFYYNVYRKSHG